jgi:hypothetical protein
LQTPKTVAPKTKPQAVRFASLRRRATSKSEFRRHWSRNIDWALTNQQSISYRFARKAGCWYIFATVERPAVPYQSQRHIFPTMFPEINATKLPQIDTTAVDHKSMGQDIDGMRKLAVITREKFQTVFPL